MAEPEFDTWYEPVEAIQAAVVVTINTLGATLLGPEFTPIASSPIPNDEIARIAGVVHREFHPQGSCDGDCSGCCNETEMGS